MTAKKLILFCIFFCSLSSTFLVAQTLDEAIKHAATETSERLANGSTIAVINFQSDSQRLSGYVIDEFNAAIVRIGMIRAVERRQLDVIRSELHLNISGEVSDEFAQSIGRLLGAQTLIMGSIDGIGDMFRIRFQAISTEDAVIQYVFSENISIDNVLISLLGESNPVSSSSLRDGSTSVPFFSFSIGGVVGGTMYWDDQYHFVGNNYEVFPESGSIINLVNPTVNFRVLFPLENRLELGVGSDITYSIVRITIPENPGWFATGTLALYGIVGYNNAYLHLGYDFVYGGLYVCFSYALNKRLLIGIPMSALGGNQYGIVSMFDPPRRKTTPPESFSDMTVFQVGLSVQYIFGRK